MMTKGEVLDLGTVFAGLEGNQAAQLGRVDDSEIRMVRLSGPGAWHAHDTADELVLVLEGTFRVEYRDRPTAVMPAGNLLVIPPGVEHRAAPEAPCRVLLVRRAEHVAA